MFLKTIDERTNKPCKFVSAKARDRAISDLLRKQQRLIEGKTVTESNEQACDIFRAHTRGIVHVTPTPSKEIPNRKELIKRQARLDSFRDRQKFG